MAALVVIQRGATACDCDTGLIGRGKAKLVAVVALMHKRLRQMIGTLRPSRQLHPEAATA